MKHVGDKRSSNGGDNFFENVYTLDVPSQYTHLFIKCKSNLCCTHADSFRDEWHH